MGENFYRVVHVINNNVVCVVNERRQEKILTGKGIGFKMEKGGVIDSAKIEKEYFLKSKTISGKLYALLARTPEIYLEITDEIVKYAETVLEKKLDDNIFLNLLDHISFSIARLNEGMIFKNILLWEIMHFYPKEYKVAQYGLTLVQKYIGKELPDDEAASIAMHLVNAQMESATIHDAVKMTELISKIVNVVRYQYRMNLDENSIHYGRFITHLKFFTERLFRQKMLNSDDMGLVKIMEEKYPMAYKCALSIEKLVEKEYGIQIPEEEIAYLAVYIQRITTEELREV